MIDRTNNSPSTTPLNRSASSTGPTPSPKPAAPAPQTQPRIGRDSATLSSAARSSTQADEDNPLANSTGRTTADVVSGASGAADGARGIRDAAVAVERLGARSSVIGGLGTRLGRMLHSVADVGERVGTRLPAVGSVFVKLAKAAPAIGVVMAALDIGKAAIEKNPEKKKIAEGQAVLSSVAGLAGVVGAGAAVGATAFGIALAPLAVPALVIGLAATGVALADQFLLGGKISKGISAGLHATGAAVAGAASAVANGAKQVWGALSSL